MILYSMYEELLKNRDLWYFYKHGDMEGNIKELFDNHNSSNFITRYFHYAGNISCLPWQEISNDNIPDLEWRAQHTVSLFIMGIMVVNEFEINLQELPKYEDDPYENFLYIWSMMCLYHDLGYYYEEQKATLVEKCPTIDDFLCYADIEYNLLNVIEDGDLASGYYKYRCLGDPKNDVLPKVDHGISGSVLMYDRLMKKIVKDKYIYENAELYVVDTRKFKKTNIKCVREASNAILRHNMWFAKPEDYENYMKFGLQKLIPADDNSHRYSIQNNLLLFLLAVLDTIEPIKLYHFESPLKSPYEIIRNMEVQCDNFTSTLTISLHNSLNTSKYIEKVEDLKNWLQVSVQIIPSVRSTELSITFL